MFRFVVLPCFDLGLTVPMVVASSWPHPIPAADLVLHVIPAETKLQVESTWTLALALKALLVLLEVHTD